MLVTFADLPVTCTKCHETLAHTLCKPILTTYVSQVLSCQQRQNPRAFGMLGDGPDYVMIADVSRFLQVGKNSTLKGY